MRKTFNANFSLTFALILALISIILTKGGRHFKEGLDEGGFCGGKYFRRLADGTQKSRNINFGSFHSFYHETRVFSC
jgi:hypothetical protein